jgi:hypothetical protein
LLLFVDAVETKQIIAPVLKTLVGDPKKVFEASYAQDHSVIRHCNFPLISNELLVGFHRAEPSTDMK